MILPSLNLMCVVGVYRKVNRMLQCKLLHAPSVTNKVLEILSVMDDFFFFKTLLGGCDCENLLGSLKQNTLY